MGPKKAVKKTVAVTSLVGVGNELAINGIQLNVAKSRSENWTEDEKRVLVEGVLSNWDTLFGKLAGKLTPEVKSRAWLKIATDVSI
jgi:hypothetical protein